jgi:hypothetical protein
MSVAEKLSTFELFGIRIAISTRCMELMLIAFMKMSDAAKDCRQVAILLARTIVSPARRGLQNYSQETQCLAVICRG